MANKMHTCFLKDCWHLRFYGIKFIIHSSISSCPYYLVLELQSKCGLHCSWNSTLLLEGYVPWKGDRVFRYKGAYRYFSNPMYGAGQLQAYAIAFYYGSLYELIFAIINQLLLFLFYCTVKYRFIMCVYISEVLHKL